MHFPTIYFSCPCSEQSPLHSPDQTAAHYDPDEEEEGKTFDPRALRSPFSMFPLENLLYCEDCHQIRCPRCVQEEIVCYYCPSCLFEVPSSTVKTEGNRCTRNCFQCPICFATLSVTSISEATTSTLAPTGESMQQPTGPYTLTCSYCHWSSLEVGLEFEKPSNLTSQLSKMKGNSTESSTPKARYSNTSADAKDFAKLRAHYSSQRIGSTPGAGLGPSPGDDFGASPSALSRLMGLYSPGIGRGGLGGLGNRAGKEYGRKKIDLTEITEVQEIDGEQDVIDQLMNVTFDGTTSQAQRLTQSHNPRFIHQVRPIAALLRTKRSKRCRACRHILVKPEPKVQSTRYRIRLVAMNYIPALNISRLDTTIVYNNLVPLNTHQFVLTVTNPLFDPIQVTLATPPKTPGKYPSIVTILCPEFEVGANTDLWDEALQGDGDSKKKAGGKHGRQAGSVSQGGTVWDSGRNWTSVVIEVIPPVVGLERRKFSLSAGNSTLQTPTGSPTKEARGPFGYHSTPATPGARQQQQYERFGPGASANIKDDEEDEEDERIVQIPIFVRVVYEAEVDREDGKAGQEQKERREQAYWCILYIGRVGDGLPPPLPPKDNPISISSTQSDGGSAAARMATRVAVPKGSPHPPPGRGRVT